MYIAFIIFVIIFILVQIYLTRKQIQSIEIFNELLEKFVEVNQKFYEGQKSIVKQEKEILEGMSQGAIEIGALRRNSLKTTNAIRSITEINKELREIEKGIESTSKELNVSKDIADSLANVSNNIKILDKVVLNLQRTNEELKRRK